MIGALLATNGVQPLSHALLLAAFAFLFNTLAVNFGLCACAAPLSKAFGAPLTAPLATKLAIYGQTALFLTGVTTLLPITPAVGVVFLVFSPLTVRAFYTGIRTFTAISKPRAVLFVLSMALLDIGLSVLANVPAAFASGDQSHSAAVASADQAAGAEVGNGEKSWLVSHPLEGRDGADVALAAIKAKQGNCSRIDDFAANGASGNTNIYLARCDDEFTRFEITENGGAISVYPLAMRDADKAAVEDDTERLDGAYGPRVALKLLIDLGKPCKTISHFAFVKRGDQLGVGTKVYVAQCDGSARYALLQNGESTQALALPKAGDKQ